MKIVLFLGYGASGKTTAITVLTKALTRRGHKVGTIKHVHGSDFTIDTEGKDSWLHAKSGASVIVVVAPQELTVIRKGDTTQVTLDDLLPAFRDAGTDYLLVEGMYRKLRENHNVIRLLCADSEKDAVDLIRQHPPPACILGGPNLPARIKRIDGSTVLRLPKDLRKVLSLLQD